MGSMFVKGVNGVTVGVVGIMFAFSFVGESDFSVEVVVDLMSFFDS
jgi:hypothetical protein